MSGGNILILAKFPTLHGPSQDNVAIHCAVSHVTGYRPNPNDLTRSPLYIAH